MTGPMARAVAERRCPTCWRPLFDEGTWLPGPIIIPARRDREWRPTPRQLEIIRQVALGRTNAEIAAALGITRKTVTNHITTLLRWTGSRRRAEAVLAIAALRRPRPTT